MKTNVKKIFSFCLAISMIFVFSSSIVIGALDETNTDYYLEYDFVNKTYNKVAANSIPDYSSFTTTTYDLNAMASELPRLQAINETLNAESEIEPYTNLNNDGYINTSPTTDPYSGVVVLLTKTKDGWTRGTGFLVAPDVIVTAGHAMIKYADGEFQDVEFRVYPFYNSINNPINTDSAYYARSAWICYEYADALVESGGVLTDETFKYDWCVIKLSEPIEGAYNFACATDVKVSSLTKYYTSGYPYCIEPTCKDNNCTHITGYFQCRSDGKIREKTDTMIFYDNNIRKGMSGGPIYKKSNNICYGIITCETYTGHEKYNGGTIINDKIYNAISHLIELD